MRGVQQPTSTGSPQPFGPPSWSSGISTQVQGRVRRGGPDISGHPRPSDPPDQRQSPSLYLPLLARECVGHGGPSSLVVCGCLAHIHERQRDQPLCDNVRGHGGPPPGRPQPLGLLADGTLHPCARVHEVQWSSASAVCSRSASSTAGDNFTVWRPSKFCDPHHHAISSHLLTRPLFLVTMGVVSYTPSISILLHCSRSMLSLVENSVSIGRCGGVAETRSASLGVVPYASAQGMVLSGVRKHATQHPLSIVRATGGISFVKSSKGTQ